MTQEEILISESEFIGMQGDEELVSQYLDYTKQKKRADKALKLLKVELLDRVNKKDANLEAGEYSVVKTTRKGSKLLNKKLVLEYINEMGADEDKFFNVGNSTSSIRIVKAKPITKIKIKK